MTKQEMISVLAAAGIKASAGLTKARLAELIEEQARKPAAKPRRSMLHVNERRRAR